MNKDGFEATLDTSHKRKPANSEYEGKVELKAGGYELGPVKGWSELQFDYGKEFDKDSGKHENTKALTVSQTLNHTDFWFGFKGEADLTSKFNLTSCGAFFFWNNGAWDFWGRGSFVRKLLSAGCTHRLNSNVTFSTDFIYDLKNDPKNMGLMGTPLFWRYGATHKFGKQTIEYRLQAAKQSLLMT